MDDRTIGVLGGGQLGRMMAEAGHRLGVRLAVLDPLGSTSPAGQVVQLSIDGSFQEADKIKELSTLCDLITVEIEHVDTAPLLELVRAGHVVRPSPDAISMIQDKFAQKEWLSKHSSVTIGNFMELRGHDDALHAGRTLGYPFMMKRKTMAYDGKGNYVVTCPEHIEAGFRLLGTTMGLYAEKMINYNKELAVVVVNSVSGVAAYPVVETHQRDNICNLVMAPANISESLQQDARRLATEAVCCLPGNENYGVFGVELFLEGDKILFNELAPRPHNSGHYTIEACALDQFEAHLRAVLGMPVHESTLNLKVNRACMVNVLGVDTDMKLSTAVLRRALVTPRCGIHWYGKANSRKGRKLAHFTIVADNDAELHHILSSVCGIESNQSAVTVEKIPDEHLVDVDAVLPTVRKQFESSSGAAPEVAVIMGSDSDLECMVDAVKVLEKFGISHEVTIVSAHRTPTHMYTFAQTAVDRGLKVIIAGAGGAAHLPGMVAALTPLPVIGVPVQSASLNGNDSLLSIVQMPRGVPVATVAIGNSTNAGLLATRIIAASGSRPSLLKALYAYMEEQEAEVLNKASRLEALGYRKYQK